MRYTLYAANDAFLRRAFLALPAQLYPPERRTQDKKTERQLLRGTHALSGDFEIAPFLALDAQGRAAARCVLTVCDGDENGYVGLFESVDDPDAARTVLDAAAVEAMLRGKTRLIGPYDASFWLGYRFKTTNFRRRFTLEPNNLPYYPRLWERCGFAVTDHYFSNHMRVPTDADVSRKAVRRLREFADAGYDFRTMTFGTFDTCLREIYALLTALYSAFPGYRPITERQFVTMFSPLRWVLDYDMVKLVYKDGRLAAFVICIPNYVNLLSAPLTPRNLRRILAIRRAPTEYVIPYMGVSPAHAGLGNALSELLRQALQEKQCTSVSALIHDGKVTGGFYRVLKTDETEYVLMARELN